MTELNIDNKKLEADKRLTQQGWSRIIISNKLDHCKDVCPDGEHIHYMSPNEETMYTMENVKTLYQKGLMHHTLFPGYFSFTTDPKYTADTLDPSVQTDGPSPAVCGDVVVQSSTSEKESTLPSATLDPTPRITQPEELVVNTLDEDSDNLPETAQSKKDIINCQAEKPRVQITVSAVPVEEILTSTLSISINENIDEENVEKNHTNEKMTRIPARCDTIINKISSAETVRPDSPNAIKPRDEEPLTSTTQEHGIVNGGEPNLCKRTADTLSDSTIVDADIDCDAPAAKTARQEDTNTEERSSEPVEHVNNNDNAHTKNSNEGTVASSTSAVEAEKTSTSASTVNNNVVMITVLSNDDLAMTTSTTKNNSVVFEAISPLSTADNDVAMPIGSNGAPMTTTTATPSLLVTASEINNSTVSGNGLANEKQEIKKKKKKRSYVFEGAVLEDVDLLASKRRKGIIWHTPCSPDCTTSGSCSLHPCFLCKVLWHMECALRDSKGKNLASYNRFHCPNCLRLNSSKSARRLTIATMMVQIDNINKSSSDTASIAGKEKCIAPRMVKGINPSLSGLDTVLTNITQAPLTASSKTQNPTIVTAPIIVHKTPSGPLIKPRALHFRIRNSSIKNVSASMILITLPDVPGLNTLFSQPICYLRVNQQRYEVQPLNVGFVDNCFHVLLPKAPPLHDSNILIVSVYSTLVEEDSMPKSFEIDVMNQEKIAESSAPALQQVFPPKQLANAAVGRLSNSIINTDNTLLALMQPPMSGTTRQPPKSVSPLVNTVPILAQQHVLQIPAPFTVITAPPKLAGVGPGASGDSPIINHVWGSRLKKPHLKQQPQQHSYCWLWEDSFRVMDTVFGHLSTKDVLVCRLVCRSWRRIVDTHARWSRITLSSSKARVDRDLGRYLQQRGCRQVDLECGTSVPFPKVLAFSRGISDTLTVLTLDFFTPCDKKPKQIFPLTVLLRTLDRLNILKLTASSWLRLSDPNIEEGDKINTCLRLLVLEDVDNPVSMFRYPSSSLPKLTKLAIGDASSITSVGDFLLDQIEELGIDFSTKIEFNDFSWVTLLTNSLNDMSAPTIIHLLLRRLRKVRINGPAVDQKLVNFISALSTVQSLNSLALSTVRPPKDEARWNRELCAAFPRYLKDLSWVLAGLGSDEDVTPATDVTTNGGKDSGAAEAEAPTPSTTADGEDDVNFLDSKFLLEHLQTSRPHVSIKVLDYEDSIS